MALCGTKWFFYLFFGVYDHAYMSAKTFIHAHILMSVFAFKNPELFLIFDKIISLEFRIKLQKIHFQTEKTKCIQLKH